MKDRYAAACLDYGSFGIYNGWFSIKEEAQEVVKLMNKRLPHLKWVLVKKSQKLRLIYWKDFDYDLYTDFINAK